MMNTSKFSKAKTIVVLLCCFLCSCNNGKKPDYGSNYSVDYSKGSSIETLDSKFADAQRKIKQMCPIEIDEYTSLTDLLLTENSVIYCCTFKLDGEFEDIDFNEIDKEQRKQMEEMLMSEQMQLMMKFCECSGRDLRYHYFSANGKLVHEQVFHPKDYLQTNE